MGSDYNNIRRENLREYGEGTRHLAFFRQLYTDQTHFIYELLQNAEDAAATQISFELYNDRLEVYHDGRLFDKDDVRGICGVGEGTKANDINKIGKFGIGFKSVYAYTDKPAIHSGKEHFYIEHYVRPYKTDTRIPANPWTTLFVLPFDRPEINTAQAYNQVANRLKNLSTRSLLFLNYIKTISFKLKGKECRVYSRNTEEKGKAKIITLSEQDLDYNDTEHERWIKFSRPISIPDTGKRVKVEIAFSLRKDKKTKSEKIVRIDQSPLFVYFPTEKETRLGFMIQGPYRTTPSRDNIPKDDDWNLKLIKETAELLCSALYQLKKLDLITISLIRALPVQANDFLIGNMFRPLFTSVRDIFSKSQLLPKFNGGYLSSREVKLSRSTELRELLGSKQLKDLYASEIALGWLIGDITQDKTPEVRSYLINELNVEEVTAMSFARKINSLFLRKQPDSWIKSFYTYLLNQEALWRPARSAYLAEGPLRKLPIIRTNRDDHVSPFKHNNSPNVYLPTTENNEFLTVKDIFFKDKNCREFLVKLGIPEIDIVAEVFEKIIPKYNNNRFKKAITKDEHISDISKIMRAYYTDSQKKRNQLLSELVATSFVKAMNAESGMESYRSPGKLYIKTDDLEKYFESNDSIWFVSSAYDKETEKFIEQLGATRSVRVKARTAKQRDYVTIVNMYGWHKRGLDGFDPDCEIDGLEHAINNINQRKSALIWNEIVAQNSKRIQGAVEESSRKSFENSTINQHISKMGKILLKATWLPNKNGDFYKPENIRLDELPANFKRNESLAKALNMKSDEAMSLAKKVGIELVDIELIRALKKHPDKYQEVQNFIDNILSGEAKFPERKFKNMERRQEKVSEKINSAAKKEYEKRERSTRTTKISNSSRTYLKNQYTNADGIMFCQICEKEMPFKKLNGDYYFDAVEISADLQIEFEAFYLALCPICAAKYKEFVKKDENICKKLVNQLTNNGDSVFLQFNKENSNIKFTETHLFDIKAALGKINISGTAFPSENRKKEPKIIYKKSKKPVEYTFCPICNVKIRKDRKNKHFKKVHQKTEIHTYSSIKSGKHKISSDSVLSKIARRPGQTKFSQSSQTRIGACKWCGATGGCYCK